LNQRLAIKQNPLIKVLTFNKHPEEGTMNDHRKDTQNKSSIYAAYSVIIFGV